MKAELGVALGEGRLGMLKEPAELEVPGTAAEAPGKASAAALRDFLPRAVKP